MDELEKIKNISMRLDKLAEEMGVDARKKGALAIRDEFNRRGEKLSIEDEKVLAAFSGGEVDFAALTRQFIGRI